MTFLLELRERWLRFYEKYEKWVLMAAKFAAALLALILLTNEVGFFEILKNPFIITAAAVLCALTPGFVTIIVLSGFLLVHLFVMSVPLGMVVVVVLGIMYLLFFRFCPNGVYLLLITVFCFCLNIPYLLPVVVALVCSANYIFAFDFGVFLYFMIHTIGTYSAMLTRQTVVDNAHTLSFISGSILNNHDMYAILITFTVTFFLTYIIRKLPARYAGFYAIIFGIICQFILLVLTDIWLDADLSLGAIVVETVVEIGIALLINALFFGVNFTRTEHFQFDDEEYYYYVKAVPKRTVSVADIKVTHINVKSVRDRNANTEETDHTDTEQETVSKDNRE